MTHSKIYFFICMLSFLSLISCGDNKDPCTDCDEMNVRMNDSLVLVDLYDSTNGANWENVWDLNMPMDSWFGVSLQTDGSLDILELQGNGLVGSLPASLSDLSDPRALEIRSNDLIGEIPSELDKLTNLKFLRLDDNGLIGNIPPEIANLTQLQVIDLASNDLNGSIPDGLGALSNLDFLDLAENQLTGTIPSDFANLTGILFLIIRNNDLSGCYPAGLTDICNSVSSYSNPKLPYEGDFDKVCNGFPQEGAPCELDGLAGTIDTDCNCVI